MIGTEYQRQNLVLIMDDEFEIWIMRDQRHRIGEMFYICIIIAGS